MSIALLLAACNPMVWDTVLVGPAQALSTFLGSDELDEDAAHAMAEAIDLDHNGALPSTSFCPVSAK